MPNKQTDKVKRLLARTKTVLVNVPGGCTSFVQVLDVCINKPFKDYVKEQSEKHVFENIDKYSKGKIRVMERRILLTKWCGEAWSRINTESVVRRFKKCGMTTAIDGSENEMVNIEHLPDYTMPTDTDDYDDYNLLDESEDEADEGSGYDVLDSTSASESVSNSSDGD